ncbi:outer membrane protein assembly factor BamA [Mongoliibacter ruber]|uniref:Outer membrane protein assembly factor BamA n=1 Tax=Mongoliibacter ruber TaxID=1750599 RepID=A0A2T0WRA1_9BACT|nr:outer membrane protein assembly factor BamA [Mongoliibacter ruber]
MILLQVQLIAQQQLWMKYEIAGDISQRDTVKLGSEAELREFKSGLLSELHQRGYLIPLISEVPVGEDSLFLSIETGEKYEWYSLGLGNLPESILIKSGTDTRQFEKRNFNYAELSRVFESILTVSENEGYPFASVKLDSITEESSKISAALYYDSGPFISFDSLQVTGDSKINKKFLSKFLQITPASPFSQKKINNSLRQINELPYLKWSGEPELSFQNEEATLYLPIDDRKINSIDGIIGFLPNELEGSGLLITGQFDLLLYNVAGRGRNYELHWQRFNQFSQSLQVSALEPLLLGSNLDVQASFSLLKEDSTFLTRDFRLDFGYRMDGGSYLRFFTRRQAGDLLGISASPDNLRFPEVGDFRFNNYGLGFDKSWLDDVFFPRRGALAKLEFAIGNKNILVNTALPAQVYEDLSLRSLQYYFRGSLEKHFYKNMNWGLYSRLTGGFMENPNLFVNDLYRLGGLRTIRGFNENFFFANNYVYLNIEPRYYFDTYSYFMIFADVARLENRIQNLPVDFPYAVGLGFSLETGNGIFNFIYALGGSNAQDFALNLSKIHFGYTGRF